MCEYDIKPLFNKPKLSKEAMYKLKIPHIINDVHEVKHLIRVRHGVQVPNLELEKQLTPHGKNGDAYYDVDDKYITIHTNHFSVYIVTIKEIRCCSRSINAILFGSLSNSPTDPPLTNVKVYFSSAHSIKIRDYLQVGLQKQFSISLSKFSTQHIFDNC